MADNSWASYDDSVASKWDACYLVENNASAVFADLNASGKLPGIARVSVQQKTNFDKKALPKKQGFTANVTSVEPCQVTIVLQLRTKADYDDLRGMLKRLSPASAKEVKTYLITHPMTDLWNVGLVYVESIDTPDPTRESGMTVTINCFQWMPPKDVKQDDPKKAGSRNILDDTPL